MYKLLALDMDGTLLNQDKLITPEVEHEIKELLNRNGEVTLATGRFPASVYLHGKALGLVSPLIALNGAVILDPKTGESVHTTPIPQEVAKKVAEFAESASVYVHFYGYNILIVNEINKMNSKWALANVVVDPAKDWVIDNYSDQLAHFSIESVGPLVDYFKQDEAHQVYKATVIHDDPNRVEALFQQISSWPELSVTRTGNRRFDINAAGVSKKTALIKLCEDTGITSHDVVAVGDFDNDVEMIKWAGLGVAMGNGNKFVKQIADATTLSNNEHGVAEVIRKYFK